MTGVAGPVRLTSFSHGAGCACKLSPDDLQQVLGLLGPSPDRPDALLVGYDHADDAAVYRLREDLAAVFTADFFTPIVDDPYDWGRIAAANALSDVYAMGGTPVMALNLVAWPRDGLPFDVLAEVLRGGRDLASEAGTLVVGGHSIDDPEPKYGLAVFGTVHPDQILTNAGGRPGDALVLTKPVGLGVVTTALKNGHADDEIVSVAVDLMTTLNEGAATVASRHGVRGGTDITGFGLLGHLREVAAASDCGAVIDAGAVPLIEGVAELVVHGQIAGGTRRNRAWVAPWIDEEPGVEETQGWLLADAQTSGGLLLAVPPDRLDALIADLEEFGTPAAAVVGRLTDGPPGRITLRG